MLLLDSIRVSDLEQVWFFAHQGFGCWQRIHVRHRNLANVLLFDGHVEKLGRGQLISSTYKPIPEYKNGHWYVWPPED
jgi:prepilin-type processing-associated H-X9-DG protein